MNRYSVITAIAVAVIAAPFVYGGLSIYGAQQMEYRWHGPGSFSFFAMSNYGKVEFCNAVPFLTSVQRFEIATFYEGNHLGSFVTEHFTSNPLASSIQSGTFTSKELPTSQHIFMAMDFELDGGDIRLDPNQFIVVTRADTPILGLIPYSTVMQYDIVDFDDKMNSLDLSCD